jgi:putative PIN family toxin of toxin-antitoxin system
MRIVVDTNVIVSALVFGGVPRRVLGAVEGGRCDFYYSAEIESETRRVLRDKFGWDERRLDRYLPELWGFGERVIPQRRVNAVRDDPDDNRILECALAAEADVIVSGDGHLLRLTTFEGIAILAARILKQSDLSGG